MRSRLDAPLFSRCKSCVGLLSGLTFLRNSAHRRRRRRVISAPRTDRVSNQRGVGLACRACRHEHEQPLYHPNPDFRERPCHGLQRGREQSRWHPTLDSPSRHRTRPFRRWAGPDSSTRRWSTSPEKKNSVMGTNSSRLIRLRTKGPATADSHPKSPRAQPRIDPGVVQGRGR